MAGSSHPPGRDRPSASAGTSPGLWPRLLRGSADKKIKTRELRERGLKVPDQQTVKDPWGPKVLKAISHI